MSLNLAAAIWGMASAVAVIGLGVFCLGGGRLRPRGAFAFGLFAVTWGLQVLVANAATLGAPVLFLALLPLIFLSTFFLVEFATTQVAGPRAAILAARLLAVAAGLTGSVLLALAPHLLLSSLPATGPRWGPLFVPLVAAPQFVAFGLALWALWRAQRDSPTPRTRDRAAVVLIGLSLYVGFAAGNNLAFYALAAAAGLPSAASMLAVFAPLAALCLLLGIGALRATRTFASDELRRERVIGLALLLPLAWGAAEGVLAWEWPHLDTVGLWRLAAVAVMAYGIARWRMWDLPQMARRTAARASGATLAAASGAAVYGATSLTLPSPGGALAALGVAGLALVPGMAIGRRLFGPRPARGDAGGHEYGQRMDAFRAALEASLARGSIEEDRAFLEALRDRFGVSEAEERLLLHYARQSVLVPRDAGEIQAYDRLRLLGEGGAGRTWLARDRARERLVVLKEPLERWHREPALREAVVREGRMAMRVRHPKVVAVEAVLLERQAPVLVLEYVDGGTLADLLRSRGALSWREAVALLSDVLEGVAAVHAAGIVHRDLKPSNILVGRNGTAKVADFGIALPLNSGRTVVDASAVSAAGTLAYMAPEVREGRTAGDRRSDVYACAAILHECLHGVPPNGTVAPRGAVPAGLHALLERALSPRPEERPATARAFAHALSTESFP